MKSVYEYLQEDKVKWRDLPYISVKKDGRFAARTFGEVISDAEALARGLILEGVRGNVMLYSPNSYYWAVADLAVLGYVGTIVPINSEWTAFDIERTLSVIEVGAILYSADKQHEIDELHQNCPELHFVCIESEFPRLIQKGQQSTLELVGNTDMHIPIMILFTSGTTNRPKAIPLTMYNLLYNWTHSTPARLCLWRTFRIFSCRLVMFMRGWRISYTHSFRECRYFSVPTKRRSQRK